MSQEFRNPPNFFSRQPPAIINDDNIPISILENIILGIKSY